MSSFETGERELMFTLNFMLGTGSPCSRITPSGDHDASFKAMLAVIDECIDSPQLIEGNRNKGMLSGTFDGYGEMDFEVMYSAELILIKNPRRIDESEA